MTHVPHALAAVFHGAGQPLDLQEFPVPAPAAEEVVVRIECCTICGSDLHTLTGARQEAIPTILGHEAIGIVEQVGSPAPRTLQGREVRPGDRITWSVATSCGSCDRCQRGLPQKCRSVTKYGHGLATGREALNGGLAEYILLRRGSAICDIDSSLSAELLAPVNCATATIVAVARAAGAIQGKRVLIFGAGMLGLTAAAYAHEQRAALVVVVDVHADRLQGVEKFGATCGVIAEEPPTRFQHTLQQSTGVNQFDVLWELSGSPVAVESALQLGDIGARIVLAGSVLPSRAVPLDPERLVRNCFTVSGVHNYSPADLVEAVAFLKRSAGRYPFESLVERTFSLREINQAVDYALTKRPVRIAVRPQASNP